MEKRNGRKGRGYKVRLYLTQKIGNGIS